MGVRLEPPTLLTDNPLYRLTHCRPASQKFPRQNYQTWLTKKKLISLKFCTSVYYLCHIISLGQQLNRKRINPDIRPSWGTDRVKHSSSTLLTSRQARVKWDKLPQQVAILVLLSAVYKGSFQGCMFWQVVYWVMPMTPQAKRPPALPVLRLSSLPPFPRSSVFSWIY